MNKIKMIYFGLFLIGIFLVSSTYFSYAFLTNKDELHGKLNIVVGTLEYKIESSDLHDNSISIPSGDTKIITLSVKSLNDVASKYELYYKLENDNALVTVGFLEDSLNTKSGILENYESKKVEVIIRNKSDSSQKIIFGVEGGLINNDLVLNDNKSSLVDYCSKEDIYTFDYNGTNGNDGSSQEFITPCTGQYKIEVWGAGGRTNYVANGGYTSGIISFDSNKKLYVNVGGYALTFPYGGYNGGGLSGIFNDSSNGGGGGATDIRIVDGKWNDFNSLKSRIMVAGAASQGHWTTFGHAGGLVGYGAYEKNYESYKSYGGTQTSGGNAAKSYSNTSSSTAGGFGYGGLGGKSSSRGYGGGGGSGYYGGGGGSGAYSGAWDGGGGSSFISGHNGCDAIAEESTEDNIIHTGQPNHYSGLVFTNTVMIDGAGYQWTIEKGDTVVGMPTHDGTSTMIGNSGNGYAKITYLGK